MPSVLAIEAESFGEHAWSEEDFLTCLRQRNCIAMVVEEGERIVGFLVYELYKHHLDVLNFAVATGSRRQGVGTVMVAKLISKLSSHRRTTVVVAVRETNLPAQLFWRSQGFLASQVLRRFYEDDHQDAFHFEYVLSDY